MLFFSFFNAAGECRPRWAGMLQLQCLDKNTRLSF